VPYRSISLKLLQFLTSLIYLTFLTRSLRAACAEPIYLTQLTNLILNLIPNLIDFFNFSIFAYFCLGSSKPTSNAIKKNIYIYIYIFIKSLPREVVLYNTIL